MPDNIEQIKENINLFDGVILSIDKFSVNARYTVSIDDIDSIIKLIPNKEIFISLNKNIENNELDELERILLEPIKINLIMI